MVVAVSVRAEAAAPRVGELVVAITDHLDKETDGPTVLTALGAAAVVQIARFGVTIEDFAASLRSLKTSREAERERQRGEN